MITHFTDSGILQFATKAEYDAYILANHPPDPVQVAQEQAEKALLASKEFGEKLALKLEAPFFGMASQNPQVAAQLLPIVRPILTDLKDGYLPLALQQIQAIPPQAYDGQFLTAEVVAGLTQQIGAFLNQLNK